MARMTTITPIIQKMLYIAFSLYLSILRPLLAAKASVPRPSPGFTGTSWPSQHKTATTQVTPPSSSDLCPLSALLAAGLSAGA